MLMLARNEHPNERITYELVATLHPSAIEALNLHGIALEPETKHDAPGPTAFAYVTSSGDEFLLIHHPDAPVPGIDVLAATPDPGALERLVTNLEVEPTLVTWRSDAIA